MWLAHTVYYKQLTKAKTIEQYRKTSNMTRELGKTVGQGLNKSFTRPKQLFTR